MTQKSPNNDKPQTGQPRLFVAVPLPAELKSAVGAALNDLKRQLPFQRWVHPEDVHITLKFIGEVPPGSAAAIERELERIAARSNPFELRLQGAGTFGSASSPRILWAGLGGKLPLLRSLQADVEQAMASIGYAPEERSYSPHLTLARHYSGSGPINKEPLEGLFPPEDRRLEWTADRIVLYRSHMGRSPMYEPLRTIVFHAGG
ncbi:RNA 2',3'-cyclic phosphodiesterase [Paenibacillus ginsengarvi]|nr:RNA 2',3'-cyclic phosphodiesterase [Paenibacillus ginsengarvi]